MKKLALLFACGLALTSVANAAHLNIAGVTGIASTLNCASPNVPTGEMYILPGPGCTLSYPLQLPVGTTIDSIQAIYSVDSLNMPAPDITMYIAQNRFIPNLGAIAIGGAHANPNVLGQGSITTAANLNIVVNAGSIYWVQIVDAGVSELTSLLVTYH